MSGEQMATAFMGFSGIYGDRCYAFRSSAAPKGAPYLTASVQTQMVRYRPQFRYPERAAAPPNLAEAMNIAPGITPANGDENDLTLDVVAPSGRVLAIDDPALVELLSEGISKTNRLKLVRSDRALTDCRPVSLISLQTIRQIETELAVPVDKRRFRANVYFNLTSDLGFDEDTFIGRTLRIGARATMAILERDPRCKMMSLDPVTGEHNPDFLRKVAQAHGACAGVYCAVLVEGMLTHGDPIQLLD
jgi:hypothetical protein